MLALASSSLATAAPAEPAAAEQGRVMSHGAYLSIAADCVACHTTQGGKPYAGGYAIDSPLGKIWSTNITPSKEFGIGSYSQADFARAVREGVAKDGHHLYPAMPYTSYAKLTDEDVAALYDYFMKEVTPVETATPHTDLPFPFSVRASMAAWNLLYRPSGEFKPDASKSAEINRGDYLVNTLAHCAACHTPRTPLMGEDSDNPLAGGSLGAWYAPNITSHPASGIGGWSDQELYAYLRTGHVAGKAQAAGPMAEAVEHSLQYLTDPDLHAIVAYLKQTKAIDSGEAKPRYSIGKPDDSEAGLRGNMVSDVLPGWRVYTATCAACHGARGEGTSAYPSLFHNTTTGADNPANLIATILHGVHRGPGIEMPGFGPQASYTERLSDQQIADVSNYVLASFGQAAAKVTQEEVALARAGGPQPAIIKLAQIGVPAGIVVLLLLIVFIVARKRRARK